MLIKSLPLLALLGVCVLLPAGRAAADEPIAAPLPKKPDSIMRSTGEAESRIMAALQSQTSLEFIDTPLNDGRLFIAELHNIPIQIDSRALRAADISEDTALTFSGKRMKLQSALNLMLQAEGLAYMIKDEALLITTPQVVAQTFTPQVYDITSLLTKDENAEEPVTATTLAETISGVIAPGSWADAGGTAGIKSLTLNGRSLLVISQTYDAQQQIFALLSDLQNAAR